MHWNDWNWECSNIVIRIGTQSIVATIISVYGPQENDLLKKNKTSFYDDVIVEIQRAYTRSPYVLVVGDFNCKLKSNLQNVAPNGKLLEQVIYDFNMRVENTLPLCEGQRTCVNNKNQVKH